MAKGKKLFRRSFYLVKLMENGIVIKLNKDTFHHTLASNHGMATFLNFHLRQSVNL